MLDRVHRVPEAAVHFRIVHERAVVGAPVARPHAQAQRLRVKRETAQVHVHANRSNKSLKVGHDSVTAVPLANVEALLQLTHGLNLQRSLKLEVRLPLERGQVRIAGGSPHQRGLEPVAVAPAVDAHRVVGGRQVRYLVHHQREHFELGHLEAAIQLHEPLDDAVLLPLFGHLGVGRLILERATLGVLGHGRLLLQRARALQQSRLQLGRDTSSRQGVLLCHKVGQSVDPVVMQHRQDSLRAPRLAQRLA